MATELSIEKTFGGQYPLVVSIDRDAGNVTVSIVSGGDAVSMKWETWTAMRKFVDNALDYITEVDIS